MDFRNLRADANTARDLVELGLPALPLVRQRRFNAWKGKKVYYMPQGFEGTCIRPVDFEANIFVAVVLYLLTRCSTMLTF